jgi:predicted TIM-barrel fold metal-dependent hydrolase
MTEIIDIHTHVFDESFVPEAFWEGQVDTIYRAKQRQNEPINRDTIREEFLPTYWDPEAERYLQRMDEAGIEKQVLFPVDWGLALGEPETSIRKYNQFIADLQNENPDRIVGFASIDPRREKAASFIDKALGSWGLQGLKLHPTTGFYLHDEETYELLEIAMKHDVPVITDTGPIPAPLYSEYSHPIHLDEVLADFPDLHLIAAHMSLGWWDELLAIAEMKTNTNLHVDISGWQDREADDPEKFATVVRKFIDTLGPDRVHFGTDDPVYDPVFPKEDWIETIRGLASRDDRPTFTDTEIEMILGGGARRLIE